MDTSTALRFHFDEFLRSVPWRAAPIVLFGADPRSLTLWQRLTTTSVLFHHSNLRLPVAVERWLARLVMTPRLHGIHHSVVRDQPDAWAFPDGTGPAPHRPARRGTASWREARRARPARVSAHILYAGQ